MHVAECEMEHQYQQHMLQFNVTKPSRYSGFHEIPRVYYAAVHACQLIWRWEGEGVNLVGGTLERLL